jgi:dethiobiotin synthetase
MPDLMYGQQRPNGPARLVVVCGTGTDVGKTWFAAQLITAARAKGLTVQARKPVQSFDPDSAAPTDAVVLAAASGEDERDVCRLEYPLAMAPPMAAAQLGLPPLVVATLLEELGWRGAADLGIVETAGGVRSPLADDADNAQFTRALHPDLVVLVADAGLGTINSVRLSHEALNGLRCIVMLNRFDDGDVLHRANRDWLADRCGFDVVTTAAEVLDTLDRPAAT